MKNEILREAFQRAEKQLDQILNEEVVSRGDSYNSAKRNGKITAWAEVMDMLLKLDREISEKEGVPK